VAAVSFVAKQKKPKVGLETKVSKDFLSVSPLESSGTDRRRGEANVRQLRTRCRTFPSVELPAPQ